MFARAADGLMRRRRRHRRQLLSTIRLTNSTRNCVGTVHARTTNRIIIIIIVIRTAASTSLNHAVLTEVNYRAKSYNAFNRRRFTQPHTFYYYYYYQASFVQLVPFHILNIYHAKLFFNI